MPTQSIRPALDMLKYAANTEDGNSIYDIDVDELWLNIFLSPKSSDDLFRINEYMKPLFEKRPELRIQKYQSIESVLVDFSDQSIDYEQRFLDAIPIFNLSPYFDTESIVKTIIITIEIFNAFSGSIKDLPLDDLYQFEPLDNFTDQDITFITDIIQEYSTRNEVKAAALIFVILFEELVERVNYADKVFESVVRNLIAKDEETSTYVAVYLIQEALEYGKLCLISSDQVYYLIDSLTNADINISDLSYTNLKIILTQKEYINFDIVQRIYRLRETIDLSILNRIYRLLTLFTTEECLDEFLLEETTKLIYDTMTNKAYNNEEINFCLLLLSSIGNCCEDMLRPYSVGLFSVISDQINNDMLVTLPGVTSLCYSICLILDFDTKKKLIELYPGICKLAQSESIEPNHKILIGKSLALLLTKTRDSIFRYDTTCVAEYYMNDSNSSVSVAGAEMIVSMKNQLYSAKIPDIITTIIDIVETDDDINVVYSMFRAMKSLLKFYMFEESTFDNVVNLTITSQLPCLNGKTIMELLDKLSSAFLFIGIAITKHAEVLKESRIFLVDKFLEVDIDRVKPLAKAVSSMFQSNIASTRECEMVKERVFEILETMTEVNNTEISCALNIMFYIYNRGSVPIDIKRLTISLERVLTKFDHPRNNKQLKGLPYATLLALKLRLDNYREYPISDGILLFLIHKLPFSNEHHLMDLCMNFILDLVQSRLTFGKARIEMFKQIMRVFTLNDNELKKYGYTETTLETLHELFNRECKADSELKLKLEKTFTCSSITFTNLFSE